MLSTHVYMDAFGCFFLSSIVKERKRKFLQKFKEKISRPIWSASRYGRTWVYQNRV